MYRSVRLAASVTAALLDSLLEHPTGYSPLVLEMLAIDVLPCQKGFPGAC
jgi:hypothetical protein